MNIPDSVSYISIFFYRIYLHEQFKMLVYETVIADMTNVMSSLFKTKLQN